MTCHNRRNFGFPRAVPPDSAVTDAQIEQAEAERRAAETEHVRAARGVLVGAVIGTVLWWVFAITAAFAAGILSW